MTTLGRLTDPDAVRQHHHQDRQHGQVTRAAATSPRSSLAQEPGPDLHARRQAVASAWPSSNCPARTPWPPPTRVQHEDGGSRRGDFPPGLDYSIVYDTTPFIEESIHEVFKTLREAIVLVALVVLVFLQNWRSTIIPLIAVPVSLVGTFAVMALLGFSLNNISLFGLVLAIGIVVDDAIVVVRTWNAGSSTGCRPRRRPTNRWKKSPWR